MTRLVLPLFSPVTVLVRNREDLWIKDSGATFFALAWALIFANNLWVLRWAANFFKVLAGKVVDFPFVWTGAAVANQVFFLWVLFTFLDDSGLSFLATFAGAFLAWGAVLAAGAVVPFAGMMVEVVSYSRTLVSNQLRKQSKLSRKTRCVAEGNVNGKGNEESNVSRWSCDTRHSLSTVDE